MVDWSDEESVSRVGIGMYKISREWRELAPTRKFELVSKVRKGDIIKIMELVAWGQSRTHIERVTSKSGIPAAGGLSRYSTHSSVAVCYLATLEATTQGHEREGE